MLKFVSFLLFSAFIVVSCNTKGLQSDLELIEDIALPIPEPSGITIQNNNLIIVSDRNGIVYTTTLDGDLISKQKTNLADLEGVTTINNATIAVVDEKKRQLVLLSKSSINKITISGENQNNNGLEGVTYNPRKSEFWVLQEKNPIKLIQLENSGSIKATFIIDFTSDLSGIYFDQNTNTLWTVSDEDQKIYQISQEGKLLNSYKIPVFKAEGITIANNIIYIVSDAYNKLYTFKMPKLQ